MPQEIPKTEGSGTGHGNSTSALLRDAIEEIRALKSRQNDRGSEPIAVIGMGNRFPGADTPEEFWELLRAGTDLTTDRSGRRGFFLRDANQFDPAFFGISPQDARLIDPQHRLLIEVCWRALEDALIPASVLRDEPVGLFAGITHEDYAQLTLRSGRMSSAAGQAALGSARSMGPARVAYSLGLTGPVMQVDTSCSSSLLAVHLACQSLRNDECEIALAGGVNLMLDPETDRAMEQLGALASDGRCKTFDASADGYARGEGCGIVVLRRLGDARKAGDPIRAVIAGSAVNHDGQSNGLTAPNGKAQEQLIARALRAAGAGADEIQYVEAHGTGTRLGDPVELAALARVFGQTRNADLYLGAVKTNIGHLESAAGIAGLIKTVLMIEHGEIPPTLHLRELNPHFPWKSYPFRVAREATAWPDVKTRRAGVSAFGMSGTNVHVILSSAPEQLPKPARPERDRHILCISARSKEALAELKRLHAARLSRVNDSGFLAAYCYSSRTGRTEWPWRIAVAGATARDLMSALDAAEPAECRVQGRFAARAEIAEKMGVEMITAGSAEEDPPTRLARLWCAGVAIDWAAFDAGYSRKRVPLPFHPLFKKTYWADFRAKRLNEADAEDGVASLIHQSAWAPLDLPKVNSRERAGDAPWLLISNEVELAAELGHALRSKGCEVAIARLVDAIPGGHRRVVYLPGADDWNETIPAAAERLAGDFARTVMKLVEAGGTTSLWVATRGAASPLDGCANPAASVLLGLTLTVAAEHPELKAGLIDLDPADDRETSVEALLRVLMALEPGSVPIGASRNGRLLVRKTEARSDSAGQAAFECRTDRTYVITGGYGGVGLQIARWLANRGARNIALIGRNPEHPGAFRAANEWGAGGASVRAFSADVGDAGSLGSALAAIRAEMPAIGGVVHAAGVRSERLIRDHDREFLAKAFRAKVRGSWNLHELTAEDDLDFFVLCSSVASLWGGIGLASYAAGNAFLDGLAHFQRRQGLPAVSINWGPWKDVGMTKTMDARLLAQWKSSYGLDSLGASEALEALERVLASGAVQAAIFRSSPQTAAPAPEPQMSLRERLSPLAPPARRTAAAVHVRDIVAAQLGYEPASSLPTNEGFFQVGMDSLAGLEILNALRTTTGCALPATTLFTYSNVEEVARFIVESLFPGQALCEKAEPVSNSLAVRMADVASGDANAALLRELEEVEALLRTTA